MPVLFPEITNQNATKRALDVVSHGNSVSYPFPNCLSLDASPGSGIVIFTLENQNFGLAA
jgi:hypothetical protein